MISRFTKRLATREKRKSQTCKVFECKIDRSHLSDFTIKKLIILFKEAKWFYNYILSHKKINDANCTVKQVPVKVIDHFEDRKFSILQTQHRQAIKERTFASLKALSSTKKKGNKVGRLTFKSELNSIPLREHNHTYYIDFVSNKIKLAGIKKKWLKINGLEQIPETAEIANATLVKKGKDFYINITTYQDKQKKIIPEASIGIDFGCETQLTFSNGVKIEFQVPTSKKIKRLDRRLKMIRPWSKKKRQDQYKRKKEYEYLANKRKDIRCKVVNAITTTYKHVCFQDENIKGWHSSNHGKKIQYSGIGGIISDLKHKSHTPIMIDRFFPSTQLCPACGEKRKLSLVERVYSCVNCGYTNDRDVKSAICIKNEGLKQIPMDDRDFKAGEISTSAFFNKLATVGGIKVSKLESVN